MFCKPRRLHDLIPVVMKDQHMQKEEREKEERLKTK
jgi:hypothetical protein